VLAVHVVAALPSEYVPAEHVVQSVAFIAPSLSAIDPAGHVLGGHVVAVPPSEYVPAEHLMQSAPTFLYPASQLDLIYTTKYDIILT